MLMFPKLQVACLNNRDVKCNNSVFPGLHFNGWTYGHVTAKISWMDRQPNFLSYAGAPLARARVKLHYNNNDSFDVHFCGSFSEKQIEPP